MLLRPDRTETTADRRVGPRVLLVQADGLGLGALGDELEDLGMRCDTVATPDELPDRARRDAPDVVLLDAETGGAGIAHAIERLRRDHRTVTIPVVAVVDGPDPDVVARADAIGVDDFVVRPFAPADLGARLTFAVRRGAARADLDPRTRLPGRRTLLASMERRMADAEPFAVLRIDLDGLRDYNDRHGVERGDDAIAAVGESVVAAATAAPGGDRIAAHLGGDDFVLLAAPDDARTLALDVVARFEEASRRLHPAEELERGYVVRPDREGRPRVHAALAVSIGVAEWRPEREVAATAVLDVARDLCAHVKTRTGTSLAIDRRAEDHGPWARRGPTPPGA